MQKLLTNVIKLYILFIFGNVLENKNLTKKIYVDIFTVILEAA